ncbi:MAG: type II secretion system protein [bacterium]|nr:type II secretion system protein [bacterium]
MPKQTKGFTLIELLIVIAILAILATVVLLVINPVQMFAQARDSQRIYDLNILSNATALYLTTAASPDLDYTGGFVCGTNYGTSVSGAVEYFTGSGTIYSAFTTVVTGAGWIPVAFTVITGGSPVSVLPVDPTNTSTLYNYTYACDNTNMWFEFNAQMESDRYKNGASGADDVESTDGGNNSTVYEVGNDPGLDL